MNRLRECRKNAGLDQKYVAVTLGVKGPSVSNWETGKTNPTHENLLKLADLYGVTIDYLMGRTDDPAHQTAFDTGEALHAARLMVGYTQRDIGNIVGVDADTVARWEQNRPKAPLDKLRAIAQYIDIAPEELTGEREPSAPKMQTIPFTPPRSMVRVIGSVRCGEGGLAVEQFIGSEPADVANPDDYFYLVAEGDSMEPRIMAGDYVLVHRQDDVESGELAVIIVDGEEGTLKRVLKKPGLVILEPLNHAHETRFFAGEEINILRICGRAIEVKRKL